MESDDFNAKRKFLLDYINKISFKRDEFAICGTVPILLKEYEGKKETEETGKIEFRIEA